MSVGTLLGPQCLWNDVFVGVFVSSEEANILCQLVDIYQGWLFWIAFSDKICTLEVKKNVRYKFNFQILKL